LIDQHAAQERVLYERLTLNETSEEVQLLLDPLVLSVAEVNQEEVEEKITIARGLGFKIEDFGPNSYKITGIPQILSQYDPETVLMSVITDDDEEKRDGLVDSEKREAVIRRICKRLAVKGGQHLSAQEQEQLIRDLENCQNPRTCPHGRPTIIHISVDALDRRFGRMGSV
jgi:DNA mismatch repair protein MutL